VVDDLGLALELADLADSITLGRYRAEDLQVETKPDQTPVTEADTAVERAIRARLAQARPDDAVVGEEFGTSMGVGAGADDRTGGSVGARRWIIDPIDGTKSYLRGMPTWSTLIALAVGDQISVGVVSAPALPRRWWAQRGHGAFADGQRIRVSSVAELGDAMLAWSGFEDWDAVGRLDAIVELGRRCWRTRGIGDAWQYMLVAEGAAEIALDPVVSLWDLAALQVIVEEAGGRFTDFAGVATPDGGDGIATNGLLHEAALSIIGR
jgi:histidinol-phosphatase